MNWPIALEHSTAAAGGGPAATAHTPAHDRFAAALLDPQAALPPGLVAWNGSDPGRRFLVHRNNVLSSLIDALADAFPVVQALVGEAFFRAMASVFVRSAPPRLRLLVQYGSAFPAFVECFGPARSLPCLSDVARLEFARTEAYHAADAAPLPQSAMQAALGSGERIGELRLGGHPSLRVLSSPCAFLSVWAAHQGADNLAEIDLRCLKSRSWCVRTWRCWCSREDREARSSCAR